MEPAKNDVFIMEEFKGEAFDKLKTFKCPYVEFSVTRIFSIINFIT